MPRGTILTFTNILPGHIGSHPHVTIDAMALRPGDIVALYPLPATESRVLESWTATGGYVNTDQGTFELSPTAQVTITAFK